LCKSPEKWNGKRERKLERKNKKGKAKNIGKRRKKSRKWNRKSTFYVNLYQFPILLARISRDPSKNAGKPYSRNFKKSPSSSKMPTAKYFCSTFSFALWTAWAVRFRQYGSWPHKYGTSCQTGLRHSITLSRIQSSSGRKRFLSSIGTSAPSPSLLPNRIKW